MTKRLADLSKKPLSVMFFVGVDQEDGSSVLPWVLFETELPDLPEEEEEFFHAGTRYVVKNKNDITELGKKMKGGVGADKPYISFLPDPELT